MLTDFVLGFQNRCRDQTWPATAARGTLRRGPAHIATRSEVAPPYGAASGGRGKSLDERARADSKTATPPSYGRGGNTVFIWLAGRKFRNSVKIKRKIRMPETSHS